MQETILVENLDDVRCKISITVPSEIVDKKTEEFLKSVKDKVEVPGFRKGMAPISVLKQRLFQKVMPSVSQMLINEYFPKAVRENSLNAVGNPAVEGFTKESDYPGRFGFDNSYNVVFLVDVLPKVDPSGYKEMELEVPNNVNKEDLYKVRMNAYREQFAARNQVDRGAQLGDTLIVDFTGTLNGEKFNGGSAEGFTLNNLGSGSLIAGFEEQLLGVKSGEEKKIYVSFPQDYYAQHLAGKDVVFDVKVNNVVEVKLAEIDNDLAMMAGFTTLEEFNESINKDVEKEYKARLRQSVDNQIFSKLLDTNKFNVPRILVLSEVENTKKKLNVNLNEEQLLQLEKAAEYAVKRAVLTNAIYEKETEIAITPDELNEALEEQANASGKSKDEVVSALYNANKMEDFVGVLKFSKVVDLIINNSKQVTKE